MNYRFRDGDWSRKWWMTFLKRDFMNLELTLVYMCFLTIAVTPNDSPFPVVVGNNTLTWNCTTHYVKSPMQSYFFPFFKSVSQ